MSSHEMFGDPVVVPGPNLRSLFTDTETVDDDTSELVADADIHPCPTCGRGVPVTALTCPRDGTAVLDTSSADDR